MILPGGFEPSYRAPYEPQIDAELREELQGAPTSVREQLRERARTDRYFLAKGILGYQDVDPYTHGPLCRALEDRSRSRRMFLMPRGHLKTTLCTITDSIGLALANPEECRILILNEIEDNAIGFLSEIKSHFEQNELLRELFPELVPEKLSGPGSRWSANHACLTRSTAYKEWTWTAAGIGKALAGNHFNAIKGDDMIGFEARESPAAMRYAISFSKSLEPLLINMDEDLIDWIGTRWAIYDLYRAMLQAYGDDMAYFAREDIENGEPIFPKKFSLKKLQRLSIIDPVLYYAQFKNNPIADGIKDFDATKLNWFDFDAYGNIVYRDSEKRLQRWNRDQLDVVMTCDPNSGELTAQDLPSIVVSAYSPKGQVFVFESWSKRVQPDSYVDMIYEMWQRWHPRALGIEKAGQQSTLFYFKKKARELGVYINVVPLTPRNRVKGERIRKVLQPLINTGCMFVRKEQSKLRHQVQFHPDLENDDELDALSYGGDLWRAGQTTRQVEEEDALAQTILQRRSSLTGYGA